MRKVSFLILAFLFALFIGVESSAVRYRIIPIPYCQVARNAEWYHGRDIRVRARLVFGTDGTYVYEDCDPTSALASLVETPNQVRSRPLGYIDEVLVTGDKAQIQTADALIDGLFDAHFSRGCYLPKFHIEATKIQLVSAIRPYSVPHDGNDGLRSKH